MSAVTWGGGDDEENRRLPSASPLTPSVMAPNSRTVTTSRSCPGWRAGAGTFLGTVMLGARKCSAAGFLRLVLLRAGRKWQLLAVALVLQAGTETKSFLPMAAGVSERSVALGAPAAPVRWSSRGGVTSGWRGRESPASALGRWCWLRAGLGGAPGQCSLMLSEITWVLLT